MYFENIKTIYLKEGFQFNHQVNPFIYKFQTKKISNNCIFMKETLRIGIPLCISNLVTESHLTFKIMNIPGIYSTN